MTLDATTTSPEKARLPISIWCYEPCYFVGGPEDKRTPDECSWCGETFGFRERVVWNGVAGSPAYHGGDDSRGSCYSIVARKLDERDRKGGVALPVAREEYLSEPFDYDFGEPPFCGWCGRDLEVGDPIHVRPLGILDKQRWFEPGYADARLYHAGRCFDEAALAGPCATPPADTPGGRSRAVLPRRNPANAGQKRPDAPRSPGDQREALRALVGLYLIVLAVMFVAAPSIAGAMLLPLVLLAGIVFVRWLWNGLFGGGPWPSRF